jgi:hypothetical protein
MLLFAATTNKTRQDNTINELAKRLSVEKAEGKKTNQAIKRFF